LTVNARTLGPRIGGGVQAVIQAAKAGDWSDAGGKVIAGGVELQEGEYTLDLEADLTNAADETASLIGILPSGGFVLLDAAVTAELSAEGLARDVIRAVQQARKDADLDVSDRIALSLIADDAVVAAVNTHAELIKAETLTLELSTSVGSTSANAAEVGEGQLIDIAVAKH
jgi:isoleucyl-tRNA synthetase